MWWQSVSFTSFLFHKKLWFVCEYCWHFNMPWKISRLGFLYCPEMLFKSGSTCIDWIFAWLEPMINSSSECKSSETLSKGSNQLPWHGVALDLLEHNLSTLNVHSIPSFPFCYRKSFICQVSSSPRPFCPLVTKEEMAGLAGKEIRLSHINQKTWRKGK